MMQYYIDIMGLNNNFKFQISNFKFYVPVDNFLALHLKIYCIIIKRVKQNFLILILN